MPDAQPPEPQPGAPPLSTFARLASGPCPPIADLLVAGLNALGSVGGPAALERLDDQARLLFGSPGLGSLEAAERLAAVLVDELGYGVRRSLSAESWLLDRTVGERRGHPLLLAIVGVELSRRAGLPAALLSAQDGWYVGVGDLSAAVRIEFEGVRALPTPPDTRRHCAHELAYATLSGIEAACRGGGDERMAKRAAALRELLPVAGRS